MAFLIKATKWTVEYLYNKSREIKAVEQVNFTERTSDRKAITVWMGGRFDKKKDTSSAS